jgi:hypothetical protein
MAADRSSTACLIRLVGVQFFAAAASKTSFFSGSVSRMLYDHDCPPEGGFLSDFLNVVCFGFMGLLRKTRMQSNEVESTCQHLIQLQLSPAAQGPLSLGLLTCLPFSGPAGA